MNNKYEVIILGGGPAGLSAAIYAGRAKRKVLVIDNTLPGGQYATNSEIANYPGIGAFPIPTSELGQRMYDQALAQRVEIIFANISACDLTAENKKISTDYNGDFFAPVIIITTGRHPRILGIEGELNLRGMGVSYCATCDGAFFKDKKVLVVGGGNSAVEEALYLTKFVSSLILIHRRDSFRAEKVLVEKLLEHPKIEVKKGYILNSINGSDKVESVVVENILNHQKEKILLDGVFIYVGSEPNTELFKETLPLDENNYILTNTEMQTLLPGVFAAGDVIKKELYQIVTAVSDGAIAGVNADKYLDKKEFAL